MLTLVLLNCRRLTCYYSPSLFSLSAKMPKNFEDTRVSTTSNSQTIYSVILTPLNTCTK